MKELQNPIVLITSSEPENSNFGTGFVFHQDDNDNLYLLTCAHVVQDVGGVSKLQIENMPAKVVASGSEDGPDDIAVIRLQTGLNTEPLKLDNSGETGNHFTAKGFQKFGEMHSIKSVKGKLGKQIGLEKRGGEYRVQAWDLKILDEDILQPGYSGSPLISSSSNKVLGIVSHRFPDGRKGVAISVKTLRRVWPNMPDNILKQLLGEGELPDRQKTSYKDSMPFVESVKNGLKDIALLTLAFWLTIVAIKKFEIWQLKEYVVFPIFVTIFTIIHLLIQSAVQYAFTYPLEKRRSIYSTKKVKFILIFFLLPLILGALANFITIAGDSILTHIVNYLLPGDPKLVYELEEIVINAEDYDVKAAGVKAIKAINTKQALESLIDIAEHHNGKFEDGNDTFSSEEFYDNLSKALASHGDRAKQPLLNLFTKYSNNFDNTATLATDYHERFFKKRFSKIIEETSESVDDQELQAKIKLELERIQLDLRKSLKTLEESIPHSEKHIKSEIDLVLDSFQKMKKGKPDKQIYEIAHLVLINERFPIETRKRAVNLFTVHGSVDDISLLLNYIDTISDDSFKERALLVIAAIYRRVFGRSFKKDDELND